MPRQKGDHKIAVQRRAVVAVVAVVVTMMPVMVMVMVTVTVKMMTMMTMMVMVGGGARREGEEDTSTTPGPSQWPGPVRSYTKSTTEGASIGPVRVAVGGLYNSAGPSARWVRLPGPAAA